MPVERNQPKRENFNSQARLPFQLRLEDFEIVIVKPFVLRLFGAGRLGVASKELPDQPEVETVDAN